MKQIRAVIVDDEKKAREGLNKLLKEDPEISVIKSCSDGLEAIEFLNQNHS